MLQQKFLYFYWTNRHAKLKNSRELIGWYVTENYKVAWCSHGNKILTAWSSISSVLDYILTKHNIRFQ